MERRNEVRQSCEMSSLVLMFGCHFRGLVCNWSPKGLKLELMDELILTDHEALVLHSERFGTVHAEVIWRRDAEIGARIRNWRTAAATLGLHACGLHSSASWQGRLLR